MLKFSFLLILIFLVNMNCRGQETSSITEETPTETKKHSFLKYKSGKPISIKSGREITIYTKPLIEDSLLKSIKHSFKGDLKFKTESTITINLIDENFRAVYPDSVKEYSKHIVMYGDYLHNKEIELKEIDYITYEPHVFTALILIGATGVIGTFITPLIALDYRNFTLNKNKYVATQTPFLIAAMCLPISFIFEKRKLRIR